MKIDWRESTFFSEPLREQIERHFERFPHSVTITPVTLAERESDKESYQISKRSDSFSLSGSTRVSLLQGLHHLATIDVSPEELPKALQKPLVITPKFRRRGIYFDMSRCGVLTVEAGKRYLFQTALCGYNQSYLYLEDLFTIPEEEYWGYMRGAYQPEELQELDQFADDLGVELIPSIQSLGHLEKVLRWPTYRKLRDSVSCILCDEEESYQLLEKAIAAISGYFRSNKIHLGMDEPWGVGRGAYIDKQGEVGSTPMVLRHLKRVEEIAKKYGLVSEIWSDIYLCADSPFQEHAEQYFDAVTPISDSTKAGFSPDLTLCYWDYYHDNKKHYDAMIKKHYDITPKVKMFSGIWTWSRLFYDHEITEKNALPAIESSYQNGIEEIVFTAFNDDGAICDFDSLFVGLTFVAQHLFEGDKLPAPEDSFDVLFPHASYHAKLKASRINQPVNVIPLLWDDPLFGLYHHSIESDPKLPSHDEIISHYRELETTLEEYREDRLGGDNLYLYEMASFLFRKLLWQKNLREAYALRDLKRLEEVKEGSLLLVNALVRLEELYRGQWFSRYKPFGFEVTQGRFASLRRRFEEANLRLGEFLNGRIQRIEELEVAPPKEPATFLLHQQVAHSTFDFYPL